jgi:hypothetical protein
VGLRLERTSSAALLELIDAEFEHLARRGLRKAEEVLEDGFIRDLSRVAAFGAAEFAGGSPLELGVFSKRYTYRLTSELVSHGTGWKRTHDHLFLDGSVHEYA